MKILILEDNNLNTVGGAQESTKIIISGIKKTYKVSVIQPGNLEIKEDNIKYYELTNYTRIKHFAKNPLVFLKYIRDIKNIINKNEYNVIHTQGQVSLFIVALLKKTKLISKKSVLIHTERGLYSKYNYLIKSIFSLFLKEINYFITTTEYNLELWKNLIAKRNDNIKMKVIENTAGKSFEIYDQKLCKNRDNICIGFSGRYCEWKNWQLAVEICEKLNNIIGDKLNVNMAVGCLDENSTQKTIKMFNKLEEKLQERFKGYINIDMNKMSTFYYDLDFFVLTSKPNTESFGRTLVEAMSRRNIVLTTNSGGSTEVVANKKDICETSDEFVDRILKYINNANDMENQKNENLKKVRNQYSYKNNIDKHIKLYQEIEEGLR